MLAFLPLDGHPETFPLVSLIASVTIVNTIEAHKPNVHLAKMEVNCSLLNQLSMV